MKQQSIRYIDRLTGEVIDLTYVSITEAEELYLTIKSMKKALEHAETKLKEFMSQQIEESYDFGDGYKGVWSRKDRKLYRKEVVRKYLDEDQMDQVLVIDGGKLEQLFSQLVEEGKGIPGAWSDIEANRELIKGKPYFELRKGKQ